jgi:hypothetical protein
MAGYETRIFLTARSKELRVDWLLAKGSDYK